MTNDWNGVFKHAEDELSRVNMRDIPLGNAMLQLLKCSIEESRNPAIMKKFISMVSGFIDKQLISPVTEEDFEIVVSKESGRDILKCKRSEHIYKDVEENKYYDNRAVGYISKSDHESNRILYIYGNEHRSLREIKLPYMPDYKIEYIE